MKEAFLYHIWRMKLLDLKELKTFHGSYLEIINFGQLNQLSGPDFYHSEVYIGNQLWAGCIEMHVNSSDWDLHQHSSDVAYHNVILHVVWNHDKEIDFLRSRNVETLVLKDFVSKEVIFNYEQILNHTKDSIPCKKLIKAATIDWDKLKFWFDGLLIDRLRVKSEVILKQYENCLNNWEEVLFKSLALTFGLKINQSAFEIWANSFPFAVIQKIQSNPLQIEALFLGQAGFLAQKSEDIYVKSLQTEYKFIQHKYNLSPIESSIFKFYSLRPHGYPTIRLAQLASIYSVKIPLFSSIMQLQNKKEIEDFFRQFMPYHFWKTHFVLDKESKSSDKLISLSKIDNIIINTIIPLRFSYQLIIDQLDVDFYLELLEALKPENNSTIKSYKELGFPILSAKDSQVVLHLKKYYCDEKKCVNCALGAEVLKP